MRVPSRNYVRQIKGSTAFYYVRTVPADLLQIVGKSKWKISLGFVDGRTAQQRGRALADEHDALIAQYRAPAPLEPLQTLSEPDRDRIAQSGGVKAHMGFLNEQAREARKLNDDAESLAEWAEQDGPADQIPDADWARSKIAAMTAERRAIESHIARETSAVRQLLPDSKLAADHPALAELMAAAPLDHDRITLSGTFKEWCRQKNPQAPEQFGYPIRIFEQQHGMLALKEITKQHMREFRDLLPTLPRAAGAAFSGLSLSRLRALARAGRETISSATAAKHLRAVGTILRFAVSEGYIEHDPSSGIRYQRAREKFAERKDDKRRSLTPAEIQAVLDASAVYIGSRSPVEIETGWFARLSIFTGARGEELAQLTPDDIVLGGRAPYLRITDAGDGETPQKVKNEPSIRIVPIHVRLLEFGFAKFVASRSTSRWLFQTLKADGRDRRYSRMQRRLTVLMRGGNRKDPTKPGPRSKAASANIADRRVTPHSFRHTFEDCLRIARVPDEIRYRLTGRTDSKMRVVMNYGTVGQIALLSEWMAKVDPLDSTRVVSDLDPDSN